MFYCFIDACYSGWIADAFKSSKIAVIAYYSSQKDERSGDHGIYGGQFTTHYFGNIKERDSSNDPIWWKTLDCFKPDNQWETIIKLKNLRIGHLMIDI